MGTFEYYCTQLVLGIVRCHCPDYSPRSARYHTLEYYLSTISLKLLEEETVAVTVLASYGNWY